VAYLNEPLAYDSIWLFDKPYLDSMTFLSGGWLAVALIR
jgi:hypothetical protein